MTLRAIRHATIEDLPAILRLIEAGRQKMRVDGNDEQWTCGNPREEILREDIRMGHSYLVVEDDQPVATFAFIPSPEPTYEHIYEDRQVDDGKATGRRVELENTSGMGQWLDEAPYYVIHRMASSPAVHGIMKSVLDFAFIRTDNLRIDTHRKNATMRRLLQKNGFQYCGIIYLADGAERLAFQRRLIRQASTGAHNSL